MQIEAKNISKKYIKEWIFRDLNYDFKSGEKYAIIGPNGSGKSTLLQVLTGFVPQTSGSIIYTDNELIVSEHDVFKQISFASPYLENVEEFTLNELLDFHFKFKTLKYLNSKEELIAKMYLEKSLHKQIKFYSSGMKQRVKLALAFFSDTSLLVLDEPTSNLDKAGIDWYLSLIHDFSFNRTILIGSNQEYEYSFCLNTLNITEFQV